MRSYMAAIGVLALLASCGDDGGKDGGADAAVGDDSGPTTGEADLPETCSGACQAFTLAVDFGEASGELDRAFYGVTSADGTLHIEAHAGGLETCPTEDGPVPDYTLILGNVPPPTSTDTLDRDDGVAVTLLDFSGAILDSPAPATATDASLSPVAASLCLDCVGNPEPSDPDGFIALTLNATFDGGTASGRVYATHCDSMDL